ncbi:MAG: endopeptidase La [Oscillospiraceae bacterium]|nr:endopeptidase La [Oscillospiraceae bacterium]
MLVIPVFKMVVLPHSVTYMRADAFLKSTGRLAEAGEKVILLLTRENTDRKNLTSSGFQPLAVTGTVRKTASEEFIGINTSDRVGVDDAVVMDGKISLSVSPRPEIKDLSDEEDREKFSVLKNAILSFASEHEWGAMTKQLLSYCDNLSGLISVMSPFMQMTAEAQYSLLKEDSLKKRAEMIENMIGESLESAKLFTEGQEKFEKDYQKVYRESAIKKQMEYLQNELDEMHPENISDLKKLEAAAESSGMNEEAAKETRRIIDRMKKEGERSQEYAMLYDYVDFIVGLPWKKQQFQKIDLASAQEILDSDHYGLKKIKKRIIQQIAVLDLKKSQSGSILCFVGAPGTGKTSIGRSIAKALGREYVRVSLGGVRDEADIRGHRRTYVGAMPGRIMDGISKAGVSNPVMVLDEIDKLSESYHGDPAAALLEVLDPEQNSSFTDHYMNVPYDLSDVLFICTANTIDSIPEPLLNRMEVISFQGYTETEKYHIAVDHLLKKAEENAGIEPGHIHIPEDTMHSIISDYTMEAGVRGLKRQLDTLCRTAAVRLVEGNSDEITIGKDELREFLDRRPLRHEITPESSQPGVVTGLAWTQAGGDILYIETLFTKGTGKVTVTGQLGDVMKESVQIAVSLVKSMFPDKADMFDSNDLHIHVPDGAVPKDGPSAGITLTTALSSLVTGHTVSPKLAMTGEVSLRGVVSPIGGLPEKLMAAKRAGVSKVFIPAENEQDLEDVADEVKGSLTIIPVTTVKDVLTHAQIL